MLQEAKQATAVASSGLESLELSSAEVEKIEELLTALDREIAEVSAQIEELNSQVLQRSGARKLRQLRREEELRDDEEQLRNEMTEQLLEARQILMRRAAPE